MFYTSSSLIYSSSYVRKYSETSIKTTLGDMNFGPGREIWLLLEEVIILYPFWFP